jgi:hypothetical protein
VPHLAGYKTYIIAGLIGLLQVALTLGYIDQATHDTLHNLLIGFGLATLRAGVKAAAPAA